ncbi:MAG: hypothetical protein BAA01_07585 [Bacillus thermozeamaize]|uniref:Probable membrane transporter protein n=1 Tax=Bacillus thermozeamaize TaxID=230954 RepID=A0A1Y3PTX4_9BACI|nr:MAG: hypothetical protein BAA01_07585 [Bacillus thermozeamaize]
MTWGLALTVFLIGFIGSFISGMVGIGGSIIKYPMLLYIPPLLGFAAYSAHEVSGISAVQVLFAALGGIWVFRKGGYLNKSLIFYMGVSILLGSFVGSYGSKFLSGEQINVVYAFLASVAAIMMFVPKKEGLDEVPPEQVTFNKLIAASSAFLIGALAGIVGAAGAFILVPVMLVILKIPTRVAIATSLAITFISSIGSTVGKIATGQVLFWPAVIMVVASLLGSPLGAHVSKIVNTKFLQAILSILILATAVNIWWSILN